jgi:membrane protein
MNRIFIKYPFFEPWYQFSRHFIYNIHREQLHVVAGFLSYVTLMSLVPLIVVTLSVMTAFPIFSNVREIIENFVYHNFLPASGDVVKEYVTVFVDNASKMSAVAISVLFVLAMMLISSIDKSLNKIWQVKVKRKKITSLSMYWMVLTLGPVLVGSSIAVSTYLVSLVSSAGHELSTVNVFLYWLPMLSSIAAFLILYMLVPNKYVPFKYALSGAVLSAVLFEVAKKGFVLYISQIPTYQAIYGALATVPILFLWVYLSWLMVLFGAVFTATLQSFIEEKTPQLSLLGDEPSR